MFFDGCSDSCGYAAALIAMVAYGSYGVPIKATLRVQTVDPLIIQSYKTLTMFVTSWLILYLGVKVSFTKYGLVSGFLWVLGSTCGIFAIRSIGMAQAIGTWASVMIAVNFIWGILIFQEPVAHIIGALGAFVLLGVGLVGMSVLSAPPNKPSSNTTMDMDMETSSLSRQELTDLTIVTSTSAVYNTTQYNRNQALNNNNNNPYLLTVNSHHDDDDDEATDAAATALDTRLTYQERNDPNTASSLSLSSSPKTYFHRQDTEDFDILFPASSPVHGCAAVAATVTVFGRTVPLRVAGIGAAVANGVLAGSSMIPLHYAKMEGYAGANYYLSFAIGALIVNILFWVLQFLVLVLSECKRLEMADDNNMTTVLRRAMMKLPEWHVRQLWFPGISAGILLSIAIFNSILAVTYLGQGVGNSIVQAKIFVRYVRIFMCM